MQYEAYSIGLGDRKIRAALEIADIETAAEVIGAGVRPSDAGKRHPVAPPLEKAALGTGGGNVVVVVHHGPAGVQGKPPRQAVLAGDEAAIGDVVVVVAEDREGQIARQAAAERPALRGAVGEGEVADRPVKVLLAVALEVESGVPGPRAATWSARCRRSVRRRRTCGWSS